MTKNTKPKCGCDQNNADFPDCYHAITGDYSGVKEQ